MDRLRKLDAPRDEPVAEPFGPNAAPCPHPCHAGSGSARSGPAPEQVHDHQYGFHHKPLLISDLPPSKPRKSSAFNDAPPIRPPSISSWSINSAAFFGFILPPYSTRTVSATDLAVGRQPPRDEGDALLGLLGRRGLAGTDRPDGLMRDHAFADDVDSTVRDDRVN